MNKKLLLWMVALIILAVPVFGACTGSCLSELNNNVLFYHDFETLDGALLDDTARDHDATIDGADPTTDGNCMIGECYSFVASNTDKINFTNDDDLKAYCHWVNSTWPRVGSIGVTTTFDSTATDKMMWVGSYSVDLTNEVISYVQKTSVVREAVYGTTEMVTGWQHVCLNWTGTKYQIIVNGTLYGTTEFGVGADALLSSTPVWYGYYDGLGTYDWNNRLDEAVGFNKSLTAEQFDYLYNGGAPTLLQQFPFGGGAGAQTHADFTITDQWNGTNISTFTVNVSWSNGTTTQHSTTNGTVNLLNITSGAINVTYHSMTDYFNQTISDTLIANITNTVTTTTYQAVLCLNATAKVNEAWVTSDNFTIDGNTTTDCFNITAGSHNVLAQKAGWYDRTQAVTVTALSNATQTIQNMSYANLTIYAIDGTTNETLSVYNLNIKSTTNPTYIETASGVTNHSFYLINDTYNVTITIPGYATTTGQANVSVSGDTNYTFKLYRANSVTITILDEITNNLITDNVTIRWTDNSSTWENTTDTGGFFIANLTVTNYTLLFYSSNYSTRTYTITVGNLSTQFLTAYMISSTYSTIFTVKDQDTGDIIPDVTFTMSKLVNSTWTTVESKYSDITGKVQVYYDPIGNYRFYLSISDYDDLIFYLNPILFSTYDVFMVKGSLLNYSVDYDDLSIIYSPKSFSNNDNTTFNFLISSPDGLLTDYGITLTYPGGSSSASGVNAIGEQLSVWVNITNATRWDNVKLEYNYTTTISGTRTFTQYLSIRTNATASENTWTANKDRTYGLGLFERVLIVTIIVIFAVGIATMVGNAIPGMAIGLFLFGFMVFIGFIPIWSILPSMFIGFLFLVWKSGGY